MHVVSHTSDSSSDFTVDVIPSRVFPRYKRSPKVIEFEMAKHGMVFFNVSRALKYYYARSKSISVFAAVTLFASLCFALLCFALLCFAFT